MPDLVPQIRSFILADSDLVSNLSTYGNAKAVFTRRPVPVDAVYPFIVIGPQVTMREKDFISCLNMRYVVYDIVVYGQNDTSENYRIVDNIGHALAKKFARLGKAAMPMPADATLVQAVGLGPFAAPASFDLQTDKMDKVARAVSVTFTITMEQ